MKSNPLIAHLATFSRKEMTRFAEFAASPYFNKHKQVRALAALLSEIYPDFSEKKCERGLLFQQLFPGQPHEQPQLAIVFTYTIRLLEQFLAIETLVENGGLEDKTLYSNQLRKRNLTQFLKLGGEKTTSNRDLPKVDFAEGASIFYQKQIRNLAEKDAIGLRLGNNGTLVLEQKQNALDSYYLTESLKDACERSERQRLLKSKNAESVVYEKIVEILDKDPDLLPISSPANIYFQLYKLLKNNDLEAFKPVKALIIEHEKSFGREEVQNLYNYLQNFCIHQINQGHQHFLKEVFNLYQHQLDQQLLLVDGVLPEWHYKNIVTTGLRLDERRWVRDFIEKYSQSLGEAVAENAYRYNLAAWHYHVGQPSEVLPLLLKVEFTDLRYNLDAKSLLLRTYFDLEEGEALLAHAEAFSQFVKRNKALTDFQKQGYFNFIHFAKRMFKLRMQADFAKRENWMESLQKLQNDMANAATIFNKSWLESKVKAL